MKNFLKIFILSFTVLISSMRNEGKAQVSVGISFQTFYDELSPYGRWINYPEYGYVWCPDDRYDNFHPYGTGGHWVWSDDYEWMWVSDYEWGWAPFHYGRWLYDSYYGWVWVPGYDWAPAWVVWRGGGDYYGWAPMNPGISINLYFGRYSPPVNYWCFAPRNYITSSRISNYYVNVRENNTIINNTTIINNYNTSRNVFVTGPDKNEAERYTGRIQSVRLNESERPGRTRQRNNEVTVYRPSVERRTDNNIVPQRVEQYKGRGRNDATVDNRPQQRNERQQQQERVERPQQRVERPQQQERVERPQQRVERPQQQERVERPQQQERVERPQQQERVERPQPQQRVERPQQQERVERPQPQQRVERPQQQERVERPQPQQRVERPQQQPQQRTEQPQQAPNRPQQGSNRGRRHNGNE